MSSDYETQKDEMLVLESIFDTKEFQKLEDRNEFCGQFYAFVTLPDALKIIYRDLRRDGLDDSKENADQPSETAELELKFLPPLELSFTLPPDYPSASPPSFTLMCNWLDRVQLTKLCQKLDNIWEENKGSEILFQWISFLKEDSYAFLGLGPVLDLSKHHTLNLKDIEKMKQRLRAQVAMKSQEGVKSANSTEAQEAGTSRALEKQSVVKLGDSELSGKSGTLHNVEKVFMKGRGRFETGENSGLNWGFWRGRGRGRGKPRGSIGQVGYKDGFAYRSNRGSNCDVKGEARAAAQPDEVKRNKYVNEQTRDNDSHDKATKVSKIEETLEIYDKDAINVTCNSEEETAKGRCLKKKLSSSRKYDDKLDSRAVSALPLQCLFIDYLKEYNKSRSEKEFEHNIFTCNICFSDKPGTQCMEFHGCGHVFCRECVSGYFEVCIKDGNVQSMKCLEGGCSSEALVTQVQNLVSPELFTRYDSLLLSSTLDMMDDIVYCPRKSCQYPVSREGEETMARCPQCHYTFCVSCKMTYHGIEPCRLKFENKGEFVDEYENATPERRMQLESKYGRKVLQDLVASHRTESWISDNSKNCPHCQAAIEKSDGCNKMTCWKCNTYFCWLCSARLDPTFPYHHFNSPSSKCFNLLFHGTVADELEDDDLDTDEEFIDDSDSDDDYMVFPD